MPHRMFLPAAVAAVGLAAAVPVGCQVKDERAIYTRVLVTAQWVGVDDDRLIMLDESSGCLLRVDNGVFTKLVEPVLIDTVPDCDPTRRTKGYRPPSSTMRTYSLPAPTLGPRKRCLYHRLDGWLVDMRLPSVDEKGIPRCQSIAQAKM